MVLEEIREFVVEKYRRLEVRWNAEFDETLSLLGNVCFVGIYDQRIGWRGKNGGIIVLGAEMIRIFV